MRGVWTFLVLAASLAALGAACRATAADTRDAVTAEAEATAVRRTAVAEVQRIIANNPTPTSLPAPTDTPPPTCSSNAIWWQEARAHIGEQRTVQGPVVGSRAAPGGAQLVEIGQPYPDPSGLVMLLAAPPPAGLASLIGKTVCVSGRITTAEGRPAVQVSDRSSIVIVN